VDGEVTTNRLFFHTRNTMWHEDETSLVWLDEQRPSIVTFVSFGSIAIMFVE
jgi:hypothetical protein